MRIIAGTHRSRQLIAPKGMSTRPTSDRLRETLFNVLSPHIPGSVFVDLYAGSGAVGIEAVSRGAAQVIFAEKAPPALAAIRANLKALGIAGGVTINERGVLPLLKLLAEQDRPADILFLDPPYEAAEEYASTLGFLGSPEAAVSLIGQHSIVVAEHSKRTSLLPIYGTLHRTRVLEQGDAALSFYRTATAAKP